MYNSRNEKSQKVSEKMQLTYEDARHQGIDMSMIAVCRKLRRLAKLDRLKLDETEHRSGLNKHLFDYIEYCGRDVLDFVKQYLSNLQPYMIMRRKDQEPERSFICVIDKIYRVSVYIKADNRQFEEVLISFHEDNKRGIARTNSLIQADKARYVPIFADSVMSCIEEENRYVVKAFFQRGLTVMGLDLAAALVTFVQNLRLTDEQRQELWGLLEEKFRVTSIRGIDLILMRVRVNLHLQ
ncbi:MAG: hypothetical protein K1W22_00475 [Lachnospiraceae bacterium]